MLKKISTAFACLILLGLAGCAQEQNFRGVPERQWQHLTGEQRQLIIDKAYQEEMCD